MKPVFLTLPLAAALLAACGDGGTASAQGGAGGSGGVHVAITGLETESSSGGFINNCLISVEARNGSGSPINLGMDLAATFDEDDLIATNAGSVVGITLYVGKMDRRERVDDQFKIRGSSCDSVTALRIAEARCYVDGGGTCNDALTLDGGGFVEIAE